LPVTTRVDEAPPLSPLGGTSSRLLAAVGELGTCVDVPYVSLRVVIASLSALVHQHQSRHCVLLGQSIFNGAFTSFTLIYQDLKVLSGPVRMARRVRRDPRWSRSRRGFVAFERSQRAVGRFCTPVRGKTARALACERRTRPEALRAEVLDYSVVFTAKQPHARLSALDHKQRSYAVRIAALQRRRPLIPS
jgi:hypothetical protein